jgi:hypothetical protein
MAYEQGKHGTFPDHEALVSVLQDIAGRLDEVRGIIDRDLKGKILPASDGFPSPGEVLEIPLPTDPPMAYASLSRSQGTSIGCFSSLAEASGPTTSQRTTRLSDPSGR